MNETELSDSIRKFYDIPLKKRATEVNELYTYLLIPNENTFSIHNKIKENENNMTRSNAFSVSGFIPPLRPIKPNRFQIPSQIYITKDTNFMIEPNTIKKQNKNNKIKLEFNDDIQTTLNFGLKKPEIILTKKYLNENKYINWNEKQLMSPTKRKILHKLDVIRFKKNKLKEKEKFYEKKKKWLIPKTHSKGIIGIDTPLLLPNKTKYFKEISNKLHKKIKNDKLILNQRKKLINKYFCANSGLLYHCPNSFKHKLKCIPLMQKKLKTNNSRLTLNETKKRIFTL